MPDQQNSQHIGQAAAVDQPRLLGQPALSLGTPSQHPSTSQWLLSQPESNTITEGDIIQWHSTHYISRSTAIRKKKNATSQNFDSIIFIYFISFFESPNLENKSLKWQLSNNSTSLQTLWDELFLFKGKRYLGLRFKLREKNCILVIINWKKNLLFSTDLEQLFSKASYWGRSIYTAS